MLSTGPLRLQGGTGGVLRNRRFLTLWGGQAASQLGDRIQQMAVLWWAVQQHGRVVDASWVMVATTLPLVVVAPFAGSLADRLDRRSLMLACDVGRAMLVSALCALAATGHLTLWGVVGLSLLLSTLGAVFSPAAMAIVPDLVGPEDLLRAGSLQELAMQGAGLVGPPLGGLLVAAIGPQAAFGANATSFIVSALALLSLGPARAPLAAPAPPAHEGSLLARFLSDLKEGLDAARERPTIGRLLAAFGLTNLFLAPIAVMLPQLARELGVGPKGLGAFEGALTLGMLAASGAIAMRRTPPANLAARQEDRREGRRAAICLALIGAALLAMARWPLFVPVLVALALLGASLGALNVQVVAYFQRAVPPGKLGRFMGLLTAICFSAQPVGFALSGALADARSVPWVLALAGTAVVAISLVLALARTRSSR